MYKLLIVDDERIIRETIANLIDWASLDIQLIGSAKNGFEAYDMIVDDCPDIVMTDIKMPGFSGIELIEKVRLINKPTQFIILSGYGEFEFAKVAMRFGVKHYLLKPCNEAQIIDAMRSVVGELDGAVLRPQAPKNKSELKSILYHAIVINILSEVFFNSDLFNSYFRLFARYEHLLDFFKFPCFLISFSSIQSDATLLTLERVLKNLDIRIEFSILLCGEQFYLFFRSNPENELIFDEIEKLSGLQGNKVEKRSLKNLADVLWVCLHELTEVNSFLYSDTEGRLTFSRDTGMMNTIQPFIVSLFDRSDLSKNYLSADFFSALSEVEDLRLLKQIAISLIASTLAQLNVLLIILATEKLISIYHADTVEPVLTVIDEEVRKLMRRRDLPEKQNEISSKIISYVKLHIEDPRLSLKWIAENVLFMNEDYISKRFVKETNMKFSEFLTETRLEKAKELLLDIDADKISEIAVRIGFGNNPKYFSQIFKRYTGVSPSDYRDRFDTDIRPV